MVGEANGRACQQLLSIHNFKVEVRAAGGKYITEDEALTCSQVEELYGRHGDIKAGNVPFFRDISECTDNEGILRLGDFRLAMFPRSGSSSNINPSTVTPTPIHEALECQLHRRCPKHTTCGVWNAFIWNSQLSF